MALSEAQLARIAAQYQRAMLTLSDRTSTAVAALWDNVGGITDTQQAAFAARAAELVAEAQRQAALLSDAYIRNYVALGTDTPLVASTLDTAAIIANARNGVLGPEVYLRPTVTLRTALSQGQTLEVAQKLARLRATAAASEDVRLAARAAGSEAMQATGVRYYRRVPDGQACTFCLVASTQRYRARDLMPLHTHCGCTVAPLLSATAPQRIIDQGLLDRLKAASPDRADYWNNPKAVIAVRQHGELGPVLTKAGDNFTGPADLVA